MQHLYHSTLGPGKTAAAQFTVRGNKIYVQPGIHSEGNIAQPWFEIRDNNIYSTIHHPEGHSLHPQFEIRNNKVFTTAHHPDGRSIKPLYTIR